MSIHRSSRLRPRTAVAVIAAGLTVAAVLAVSVSGAPAVRQITQDAAVSQGSATTLCSASSSAGTWTISTSGIEVAMTFIDVSAAAARPLIPFD